MRILPNIKFVNQIKMNKLKFKNINKYNIKNNNNNFDKFYKTPDQYMNYRGVGAYERYIYEYYNKK